MIKYFEFEKKIEEIDNLIINLKLDKASNLKIDELELEKINILKKIYSNLDPWQKVQVSRHNDRPHTIDYVNNIFDDIIFCMATKNMQMIMRS